jgi:hypothetical protein
VKLLYDGKPIDLNPIHEEAYVHGKGCCLD